MSNDEIATFFDDPNSSKAVILAAQNVVAPIIQGSDLTDDELTGGGIRVEHLMLDGSGSMAEVGQLLRECFNDEFVPAVRAAREGDISALRIGGSVFSDGQPVPIWRAANGDHYHALDDLPKLTQAEYDPAQRGGLTNLHGAIIDDTARVLAYAAQLQNKSFTDVDVDFLILSDGADNLGLRRASEVKQLIGNRQKSRVRYGFCYFQTDWGNPDPVGYATNELGIDREQVRAFLAKPGESPRDRDHRFRQMVRVISRVSASKGVSVSMAAQSVLDDDELA